MVSYCALRGGSKHWGSNRSPRRGADKPRAEPEPSYTLYLGIARAQNFLRCFEFERPGVNTQLVAPPAQALQSRAGPAGDARILNGRPAASQHGFERVDQSFGLTRQPWKGRVLPHGEVIPARRGPFFRSLRERDLSVYFTVHTIRMRRGRVVLNDNLGFGIDALQTPDECHVGAQVLVGLLWIADNEREFGNDAELPDAGGEFKRLTAGKLLVHLPQNLVGARFCAQKDHLAAGLPQGVHCGVGVAQENIDPAFTPPAQFQRCDAVRQISHIIFAEEEIVVVKLNGVDRVLPLHVSQNARGAFGGLGLLASVSDFRYAAELAAEGAAVAGVMDGGAVA